MKILAKVNRGLIITVIALAAVIVYLVTLSVSQNNAKPDVKKVCESYLKVASDYKMLPEGYRKKNTAMPKTELDKYISDMTKDIKSFYIDNKQSYKYVIEENKASLTDQAHGSNIVYEYKLEVADYKDIVFDNNTVTVTILADASYKGPDMTSAAAEETSFTTQTTNTLILQKVGGKWKMAYADMPAPSKNGNTGGKTIMYRSYQ